MSSDPGRGPTPEDDGSYDFEQLLRDLDLGALEAARNKVDECAYFLGLASKETERAAFRWLVSAFLSAAYSYFEMTALEALFKNVDDNGDTYADRATLVALEQHVEVQKSGPPGRERVKTIAKSAFAKRLYEFRRRNTHHFPLSIMEAGPSLPQDFYFGQIRGTGEPVLAFCTDVMDLVRRVQREMES